MEKNPSTIKLGVKTKFTTLAPMTVEEKKAARSRYGTIDESSDNIILTSLA